MASRMLIRPEEIFHSVHAAYSSANTCHGIDAHSSEDAVHAQSVMQFVRATLQIESSVQDLNVPVSQAPGNFSSGSLEDAFPRARPRAVHTFASSQPNVRSIEPALVPAREQDRSSGSWGGSLGDILPPRANQAGQPITRPRDSLYEAVPRAPRVQESAFGGVRSARTQN